MPLIKYIGNKPVKFDNVAGTGLSWTPGETHDVQSDKAVAKLLEHPMVWEILDDGPKFGLIVVVDGVEEPVVFDGMTDPELRLFAVKHKLDVGKGKRGDVLRQAIVDAAQPKE